MMRAPATPHRGQTMPVVRFAMCDTPYLSLDIRTRQKDARTAQFVRQSILPASACCRRAEARDSAMTPLKAAVAAVAVTMLIAPSALAEPQHRGGGGHAVVGHAVPRGVYGPRAVHPGVVSVAPYRPYYYRPYYYRPYYYG